MFDKSLCEPLETWFCVVLAHFIHLVALASSNLKVTLFMGHWRALEYDPEVQIEQGFFSFFHFLSEIHPAMWDQSAHLFHQDIYVNWERQTAEVNGSFITSFKCKLCASAVGLIRRGCPPHALKLLYNWSTLWTDLLWDWRMEKPSALLVWLAGVWAYSTVWMTRVFMHFIGATTVSGDLKYRVLNSMDWHGLTSWWQACEPDNEAISCVTMIGWCHAALGFFFLS